MSEAYKEVGAASKRKRARRHAAKVSSLKKARPVSRKGSNARSVKKGLSNWKGVGIGALILGLCVLFGVQSAYQSQRMRALYSQLQQDQVVRDDLLAQRSRLLIERGAMNSYNGTEKLAKDTLDMRFPETIRRIVKPKQASSNSNSAGLR